MRLRQIESFLWSALTTMLIGALIFMAAGCATMKPNPTDPEIQQTRKIALKIFAAVELAGQGVEGIQMFEIGLFNAGKVTPGTHGAFQNDLLITAKIVRTALTQIQLATRVPELRMSVELLIDNLNDLKARHAMFIRELGPAIDVIAAGLSVILTILGGT